MGKLRIDVGWLPPRTRQAFLDRVGPANEYGCREWQGEWSTGRNEPMWVNAHGRRVDPRRIAYRNIEGCAEGVTPVWVPYCANERCMVHVRIDRFYVLVDDGYVEAKDGLAMRRLVAERQQAAAGTGGAPARSLADTG